MRPQILLVGLLLSISVLMFSSIPARGSTPEKAKYAQLVAVDHADQIVIDINASAYIGDQAESVVIAAAKELKTKPATHQVTSAAVESRRTKIIKAADLPPPPLK